MEKNKFILELAIILTLTVLTSSRVIENQKNITNPKLRVTREHLVLVGSSKHKATLSTPKYSNTTQIPPSLKQYQYDDDVVVADEINSNESILLSQDNENYENNEVDQTSAELVEDTPNVDDTNPINQYCKCTTYECHCCRSFLLPVVPIRGPGCATVQYLEGNKMSVGIRFGNQLLASRVISGSKTTPICLPLPGGFSRFCARIYGITRRANDFKACLGLELRADNEVEAALRVSCFNFGPKGLSVAEAEPLPPIEQEGGLDEDDEDDEADEIGDFFSFGEDDDSDENDDDTGNDETDDDDSPIGFSLLNGEFLSDLFDTSDTSDTSGSAGTENAGDDEINKENEVELSDEISDEVDDKETEIESNEADKDTESAEQADKETESSEEESSEEEEEEEVITTTTKKPKKKLTKKPSGFFGSVQNFLGGYEEEKDNEVDYYNDENDEKEDDNDDIDENDDDDDYEYEEGEAKKSKKMSKQIESKEVVSKTKKKPAKKSYYGMFGRFFNFMS